MRNEVGSGSGFQNMYMDLEPRYSQNLDDLNRIRSENQGKNPSVIELFLHFLLEEVIREAAKKRLGGGGKGLAT